MRSDDSFSFSILVALVSNLPESQMAIGTGFAQLLRGLGSLNQWAERWANSLFLLIGQVGGLASASAVFQSRLDTELHERLPSGSEEVCLLQVMKFHGLTISPQLIKRIRHSARLVGSLPTDIQRLARDSYASSLKSVFILAACASLLAYICRLPVSPYCWFDLWLYLFILYSSFQICSDPW